MPEVNDDSGELERERWRGQVDGFIDTTSHQIKALFDSHRMTNEKIDQTGEKLDLKLLATKEELSQKIQTAKDGLDKSVTGVSTKLTTLTAKIAVVAAFASFIGTGIMGVFIAVIVKALAK